MSRDRLRTIGVCVTATARAAMLVVFVAVALAAAGRDQTPPSAAAAKPHPEIPDGEAATCLTCHEDTSKGTVVHAPVAGGLCTGCHEFSGTGDDTKVALAAGAVSDAAAGLCTTCHEDVAGDLKAAVQHAPVASGECLTCHDPHTSEHPGLLKGTQGELCVTCHDDLAGAMKQASIHAPAAARCSTCHNPHGGANQGLLWEAPNALCQACHALPAVVPGMPLPEKVSIGDRIVIGRADLPSAKQTNLDKAGRGHPLVNHPTSGPSDPLKKDRPFTCVSCHTPHGSPTPKLLAFELKPGEGVCQKCHVM